MPKFACNTHGMLSYLSRTVLKLFGWKIHDVFPPGVKKCVIAVAPHTSNWDFVIGRLAYWVIGVKVHFLIKKEAFRFPFGGLLRALGGIAVDRSRNNRLVDQVTDLFHKADSLYIVITPEGTRKRNPHWKKGFYHIALKAGVPIALGYLDYKRKEGGVGKMIVPDGNLERQLREIKEFYKDKAPRHPEKFDLGLDH
jgi:1-acyl-sn-glycerol-3-phosphate acyltransferase